MGERDKMEIKEMIKYYGIKLAAPVNGEPRLQIHNVLAEKEK